MTVSDHVAAFKVRLRTASEYAPAVGDRVDETGAAFAGSQLQTQIWVNRRPELLSDLVCDAFPDLAGASISWVSPTRQDRYREYQEQAFLQRIEFGRLGGPVRVLASRWTSVGRARDRVRQRRKRCHPA